MKKINILTVLLCAGVVIITPVLVSADGGHRSNKSQNTSVSSLLNNSNHRSENESENRNGAGNGSENEHNNNHNNNECLGIIASTTRSHGEMENENDDCVTVPPPATSTPPVISNVTATNTGTTTASVKWNTDILSNSKVFLSTSTPLVMGGVGVFEFDLSTLVLNHQINISSLTASTTYHFFIVSTSASGKTSTSTEYSFVTSSVPVGFPTYTLAQVGAHNTPANCWTAISGSVYDLTSYISSHPGGVGTISLLCGIDGTTLFNGQHGSQSGPATILVPLKIGTLI